MVCDESSPAGRQEAGLGDFEHGYLKPLDYDVKDDYYDIDIKEERYEKLDITSVKLVNTN